MTVKAKAYPYPYLAPFSNDYVQGVDFDLLIDSVGVEIDANNELHIPYEVVIKGSNLDEELMGKSLALFFDIRCPLTFFSELRPIQELTGDLIIDGSNLEGSVTIVARLVATGKSDTFQPQQVNHEFGNAPEFEIEAGDLLGETETHRLPVRLGGSPKEFTPRVVLNSSFETFEYRVITDKPRLELHVGADVKMVVERMEADSNLRPYLWMGIYKDVLLEALKDLKENSPDLGWAKALEFALSEAGIPDFEKYASSELDFLAQRLISDIGVLEVANGLK